MNTKPERVQEEEPRAAGWLPRTWVRGGHLMVLWAFAFVQPLLDLLGRNSDFFIARGNDRVDILIFAFAVTLVPPLVALALEALIGRLSQRALVAAHLALVAVLVTAIALGAINEIAELPAGVQIALAGAAGAAAAAAYRLASNVRSMISFLIPAPAVFLAIFLLFSDVGELVLPQPDVEALAASGNRDAPVVLIIFDELPAATLMTQQGTIDARRFPNFGKLARSSTWYRQATTVADYTTKAVPAILSGLEPRRSWEPTPAEYPRNLFTLLAGSYDLNVHEAITRLCPRSLCGSVGETPLLERLGTLSTDLTLVSKHLLLPQSLAAGLNPVDQGFTGFDGSGGGGLSPSADRERIDAMIAGIPEAGTAPVLSFVHVLVPHVPWRRLPDGRSCASGVQGEAMDWITDGAEVLDEPWLARQAYGAHLLQAGYADRLLGEIVAGLKQKGVWDEATVVVTSDHGASFEPGTRRRAFTSENVGRIARVPLFVKAPGQDLRRISDRNASGVDVLPTIAAQLGLRLPFKVDGVPADEARANRPLRLYSERAGGWQTFKRSSLEPMRRRQTAVKEAILRRGPLTGVFEMGPYRALIGNQVEVGPSAQTGSFDLVAPDQFKGVDAAAETIPCHIGATLTGVEPGEPLAIALNGQVAATTRAHVDAHGDTTAFAITDPKWFRDGDNEVEIFRITPFGTSASLEPLEPS